MAKKSMAQIGTALTTLGLEDKFLSNGHLACYPLAQRATLAQNIIDEKLRLGRWEGVIDMIYGGFGKADALFDGDYNQLKDNIVKSAIKYGKRLCSDDTFQVLAKREEYDLLFRLATEVPSLNHDSFFNIRKLIPSNYFASPDGFKKHRELFTCAAQRCFELNDYSAAFSYVKSLEDKEGIKKVFDLVLEKMKNTASWWYDEDFGLLEEIALSDPEKREERLKMLIRNMQQYNPKRAFELYKEHHVNLEVGDLKSLCELVTQTVRQHDLFPHGERHSQGLFDDDPDLLFSWAEKHVAEHPRTVYHLLIEKKYEGPLIAQAVKHGLRISDRDKNSESLWPSIIDKRYLLEVYPTAPFEVKAEIAKHLKDFPALQILSKEVCSDKKRDRSNLETAYRLWIRGKGSLTDPYFTSLRTKLIKDALREEYIHLWFLDSSDISGMQEAFDFSMKIAQNRDSVKHLETAYTLASSFDDEQRLQQIHEVMIDTDPQWALHKFIGDKKNIDSRGVQRVVAATAEKTGSDPAILEELVKEYLPAY